MTEDLTDPPFEQWVSYMFDHPVTEPAWYWDIDEPSVNLSKPLVVEYATRLFQNSGSLLAPYSDEQLNQGLWYLIGESTTDLYALRNLEIPLEARLECIRSIYEVYRQCFLPRCTQHLSYMDEPGAGPLNGICYMWWDIFPLYGQPKDPLRKAIDEACMSVMKETLELPSEACQEAALHGLGHWGLYYEDQCKAIIEPFLRRTNLRPELLRYAKHAHMAYVN